MRCWRHAVHAHRHTACVGNFHGDLGAGQHAAVAGLGALAELDLNHLHLRFGSVFGEALGAETAIRIAAAKVARADFPNQVAAVFSVVYRY